MGKLYEGSRISGDPVVTVNGKPLNPRFDLRNHSPDGFEWGYGGSGPAQLACALVADVTGLTKLPSRDKVCPACQEEYDRAEDDFNLGVSGSSEQSNIPAPGCQCRATVDGLFQRRYMQFKAKVVSHLGDRWTMTEEQIRQAIDEIDRGQP